MKKANNKFTWYVIRDANNYGTILDRSREKFNLEDAKSFLSRLQKDPHNKGEEFQIVKVTTTEKSI